MYKKDDLDRRFFLKSIGFGAASIAMPRILFAGDAKKRGTGANLVERLGYPPDARLLITTADEFGQCHASNVAIFKCWEMGLLKSASWMAVGPWAPEAAEYARNHPEMDVGVHLTLTRGGGRGVAWRPLLPRDRVPGLCNPVGHLWGNGKVAWAHASADEIKRESRAQIEHAIQMGIDPTHIDAHDGIRSGNLYEFAKLYGELGEEFAIPIRMPPTQEQLVKLGHPSMRARVSQLGVLMCNAGISFRGRERYRQVFREIPPGFVFDIYPHPIVECPEAKAIRGENLESPVGDFEIFTKDRDELIQAIKEEGLILIDWRTIRDLQRSGS